MAKILLVKANDRPAEQAVSVQMYEAFLKTYKESNSQDQITELDLYNVELPYYGNAAITGLYKAAQGYEATAAEQQAAEIVNRHLNQFLEADKIVFAFPLWNLTVPAPLNTYISYLTQAGKTFRYTAEGPVGLVGEKKAVLLCARGGDYSSEYMAPMEMGLNYVKNIIGFWGIKNAEVVVIEGHNQYQDRSAEIIASGLSRTAELAASF
ncbi:FMN-dependent NADH-azoreductase [Paenibacillus sp. Soil522]|uniref:FMN-dependent NADH-azoreductase n=1 Tax=Paenibacillus sp. Soil522 TaxID=1736388 RepID=UPI0009D6F5A1|nr:FMN-dependent NADH-azoreductase [Paenibacillus sp. Soil522]